MGKADRGKEVKIEVGVIFIPRVGDAKMTTAEVSAKGLVTINKGSYQLRRKDGFTIKGKPHYIIKEGLPHSAPLGEKTQGVDPEFIHEIAHNNYVAQAMEASDPKSSYKDGMNWLTVGLLVFTLLALWYFTSNIEESIQEVKELLLDRLPQGEGSGSGSGTQNGGGHNKI